MVANTGSMGLVPLTEMADEDFDRVFAVNAKGGFKTLREAARWVHDGGRIVTMSSTITVSKADVRTLRGDQDGAS